MYDSRRDPGRMVDIVRGDFLRRMGEYTPEQLGFLDETSKDDRTCHRKLGRARVGQRAEFEDVFVRGKRVSALGLLTLDGMAAKTVREGSFTREAFLEFFTEEVVRTSLLLLWLKLTICIATSVYSVSRSSQCFRHG